jgi:hypothetical protein
MPLSFKHRLISRVDRQRCLLGCRSSGLFVIAITLLTCCAPQRPAIYLVRDRDISLSRRVDAVEKLDADAERCVLLAMLWDEAEPTELRLKAIEALSGADPALLTLAVGEKLESIVEPRVVNALCQAIARPYNMAALPGLIKRWAQPWPALTPRPEPTTIMIVTGEPTSWGTLQDVVLGAWPTDVRIAAWSVLVRDQPREDFKQWLEQTQDRGGDALVSDLRASVTLLDEWPAGRLSVLWLMLRRGHLDAWAQAQQVISTLGEAERQGLALRHLPLLGMLGADRAKQLVAMARQQLPKEGGVIREGEVTTLDGLSWPDRALASVLLDALGDTALLRELFDQADADRLATQSEYGGVLGWSPQRRVVARPIPPQRGSHDRAYIAPPQLLLDAFEGLAMYHFHAERTRNAQHAGPARGDRVLAENTGLAVVIFTTLDRDVMNVDVLFPGGVCVDLGTIHRP